MGARAAVWRYDPVVPTSLTPPAWHRANFAALARALAGIVDEVVVSFVQVYRKTARNMDARARARGFEWWDPPDDEKRDLLGDLAEIAADTTLALAPVDARQARAMIRGLKADRLLRGTRGAPPADRAALVDVMVRLSRFAWAHGQEITEIDLNPVMVLPRGKGVRIVDALIVPRSRGRAALKL